MAVRLSVSYDNQIVAELMYQRRCELPFQDDHEVGPPKVLGVIEREGETGAFLFLRFVGHRNPTDNGLTAYHIDAGTREEAIEEASKIYLSIKDGMGYHKGLAPAMLVPSGSRWLHARPDSKREVNATAPQKIPSAFISYSWEDKAHQRWVHDFAARLRRDGVDATLDQWHAVAGDQIPQFMETAIRESDFVLMICTPVYKMKSDLRRDGVGFEGGIITAEVFAKANHRKFIPLLRKDSWSAAAASYVLGKLYIDLRGDPYSEENYDRLLNTIHGALPSAPPVGGLKAEGYIAPLIATVPATSNLTPESEFWATDIARRIQEHVNAAFDAGDKEAIDAGPWLRIVTHAHTYEGFVVFVRHDRQSGRFVADPNARDGVRVRTDAGDGFVPMTAIKGVNGGA